MDNERIPTMPQNMDSDFERIPTMPQNMDSDFERIPTMPQNIDSDFERIPTMPQNIDSDFERIPTMPQNMDSSEVRIPTMPQNMDSSEERIPTVPQNMGSDNERVATIPQDNGNSKQQNTRKVVVNTDINFLGDKGGQFVIEARNIISINSGESQIYGCRKEGDSHKYVARVLISVMPDSDIEKRITRNKVIGFLDSVCEDRESHILPLIDHATVDINGKLYYVEVYPFCEGGDLLARKGQLSYDDLKRKVIPGINEALHRFHEAGLVHRDIKPDNLYKFEGKVVIADFGITCDLRDDGFATDTKKIGTLGYYAPELMSEAAIKASDYYSFGQTIWTLYDGKMMYSDLLYKYREYGVAEQRSQINFKMMNNEYYGLENIGKGDEFLEVLICGLLQYAPTNRFDYEKVNRWLKGDKSLAHEIANYDSKGSYKFALKLFDKECWDDEDVCDALCSNWTGAIDVLYDGLLHDFYNGSQIFDHAQFMKAIMKRYTGSAKSNNNRFLNNIGLAKVILFLSNNKILCWRGTKYTSLRDVSIAVHNSINIGKMDNDYYGLICSELIGEWYDSHKNKNKEMSYALNDLCDIYNMGEEGALISLKWLSYLFNDEKVLEEDGWPTIEDFARSVLQKPSNLYGENDREPIINLSAIYAYMCMWGYSDSVKNFISHFEDDYIDKFDYFLSFLESALEAEEDKKMVRNFYNEYGPKGYLVWWKNNISLYTFVGAGPEEIKKNIENVTVDKNASIKDQREALKKLESYTKVFLKYMESDLFLVNMGITGFSEEYIYSDKLTAMWQYRFIGQIAPIGYKYYIEL